MAYSIDRLAFALLALMLVSPVAVGEEAVSIRIAGWNMEGNGDTSINLLETQLAAKKGVDIWGLSEVLPDRFDDYCTAAAQG